MSTTFAPIIDLGFARIATALPAVAVKPPNFFALALDLDGNLDLPAVAVKPLTFIGNMADLANATIASKDEEHAEKCKRFEDARDEREQFIMTQLTITYFQPIKDAIRSAAENGKRNKHMNFDRTNCKANFPTLGSPAEVLQRWLTDITDPASKYAPKITDAARAATDDDDPDHLEGLQFEVWNNGAFTVHFTW